MSHNITKFLAERENPVLTDRKEQLALNYMSVQNFKAYLKHRLTMFPNESRIDFEGGSRYDGQHVAGRCEYTPLVNYLPTIVDETSNFSFFNPVDRQGGSEEIISNINGNQDSVDVIMRQINDNLTIAGWSWIKVDMPASANQELTLAQKEQLGIRPFWTALSPLKVVDWDIERNNINWVLEEDYVVDNTNPLMPSNKIKVRRLWEPGRVTVVKFVVSKDRRKKTTYQTEIINTGYDAVPFVLVGTPSSKSHIFDVYESINKNILDLESSNKQIFLDCAFPQAYINESTLNRLYQEQLSKFTLATQANNLVNSSTGGLQVFDEAKALDAAFRLATGTKRPMVLGEGESPHVAQMPGGLGQIRDEITAVVRNLMEQSKILLQRESHGNVSGLSKAYDLLGIQGIVSERCRLLQNAENQAVTISNNMDSDFTPWVATYNPDLTPIVPSDNSEG